MILSAHMKIAILGFWREGLSTLRYLRKSWVHDITIIDARLLEDFSNLERGILAVEKHLLGESYLDTLAEYDLIIKSPGISPYHPNILPYRSKLSSQAQLFSDIYKGKIIAVTGTKGKSTTTSLIYTMLKDAGYSVGIVGNIGNPVLDALEENYDYVVFEMSSYMLDWLSIDPYISIIVNIYSEHLDYHLGYENYTNAKLSVIGNHSLIVYPTEIRDLLGRFQNERITFGDLGQIHIENGHYYTRSTRLFETSKTQLIWDHNLRNIMATIAVWNAMGISIESIESSIAYFRWLPHRLEYIETKNGISFYDDAISTTPESTIAAIHALEWIETIFLGGSDRGYEFSSLIQAIQSSSIRNIVFFPDTGIKIQQMLIEWSTDYLSRYKCLITKSMKEAVDFAFSHTTPWKICILSCASPSYSIWKNFEVKWDEFQNAISMYND